VTRLRSVPILFLALAVATSVLLSACSGRSGVAITVNGTSLTNQDFTEWLAKLSASKAVGTQLESSIPGTYSTGLTTALLNQQVEFAVVESELAKRNITLTQAELTTAESTAASNLAGTSVDPSTGQQVAGDPAKGKTLLDSLGTFKTAYVRFIAGQTALEEDYAKKRGTPAELKKLFDANQKAFQNQACVTVLEVLATTGAAGATGQPAAPTAAQKAAALAQTNQIRSSIKSDADFVKAAAAMAQQEGSTNGGDLGCAAKGAYATQVPALDKAIWSLPVGEVSQPIAVSDGYLLVRVSARGDLSFEQVKSQLQQAAAQQSVTDYQNWLSKAVKKAEVSVDPQWGSWNTKTGVVVAPVGASTSVGSKPRSTTSSLPVDSTSTTSP
jgi:parvulin-like peptidyl-prolyl isomerase